MRLQAGGVSGESFCVALAMAFDDAGCSCSSQYHWQ